MGGDGCRGLSDVFGGGCGCGEVRVGRWGGLGPVVSLTQERAAPGEGLTTHRSSALCKMPATHPRMHRSLGLPLSLFFVWVLSFLLSGATLPCCPALSAAPPNRRRDDSASLRPSCPTAAKKKGFTEFLTGSLNPSPPHLRYLRDHSPPPIK